MIFFSFFLPRQKRSEKKKFRGRKEKKMLTFPPFFLFYFSFTIHKQGYAGPHDAGSYNDAPDSTGFFAGWGGAWDSEYG